MPNPPLLLLHGALGASDQFTTLLPLLREHYQIHTLDFEGHGRAPLPPRPFRIEHFVDNVYHYLQEHALPPTHVFGYSLGGYVACALALIYPQLVHSVATLGTIFHWDHEVAAREVALLDPDKITFKVPHLARTLATRHTAAGWEAVCHHTRDLLWGLAEQGGLSASAMQDLPHRVRIIIGDRDTTASLMKSYELYRALPHGELEVLPNTPHPYEKVSLARLAYSLKDFFGSTSAVR